MKSVIIEHRSPQKIMVSDEDIENLVVNILDHFGLTNRFEVEIIFVSKREINLLNKKHRNINEPTDVLSFPLNTSPNNDINMLGSIVLSPEIIMQRQENIKDVIKHGMLHLLGYDHDDRESAWRDAANKIGCNL